MLELFSPALQRWFDPPVPWGVALGAAAAVLVVGFLAYRFLFWVLGRLSSRTHTSVDDLLLQRMRPPARALVGLWAVHALLLLRGVDLSAARGLVVVVELLLVAYLLIEAGETLLFDYWFAERRGTPVPALVRHLILIVLYTAVVLSVLSSVTGLNVVPVLATSTVVTVVLGLALQDTLGNLFSGLSLHFDRPFTIGDWVLVDGLEGQVVSLSWRSTHLRTLTRDIVAVPNSLVSKARVQNFCAPTRLTGRNLEILVELEAAPEAVDRALFRAAATVPGVLSDPPPKTWLVAVLPYAQRYVIRLWVDDFERHDDTESNLMKALWHTLREEGVMLRGAPVGVGADGAPVPLVHR